MPRDLEMQVHRRCTLISLGPACSAPPPLPPRHAGAGWVGPVYEATSLGNPLNPGSGPRSPGENRRGSRDNPGIAQAPSPDATSLRRATRPRGWLHRAADRIAPGANPARVVYGIVVVGALLAAESGSHESFADTLGSAVIALAVYWLAHAYSDVLGRRLLAPGRLTVGLLWRALKHEWAIVEGAAIPLIALV